MGRGTLGRGTVFLCLFSHNEKKLSFFNKFFVIFLGGFKITSYFCISKNDKLLTKNNKRYEKETEFFVYHDACADSDRVCKA